MDSGSESTCGASSALAALAVADAVRSVAATSLALSGSSSPALTIVSGTATVRLPNVKAEISISETFVFSAVLIFGPSAGVLTVLLDAAIINLKMASARPCGSNARYSIWRRPALPSGSAEMSCIWPASRRCTACARPDGRPSAPDRPASRLRRCLFCLQQRPGCDRDRHRQARLALSGYGRTTLRGCRSTISAALQFRRFSSSCIRRSRRGRSWR